MNNLFNGPGFLGTTATFHSDAALILILVTAVLFTIGWQLAVRKRYEAHRWVQTSAVIINTLVVLFVMISSFLTHILPGIPGKLNQGDYAVTTVHALVGLVGLVLGVFIVLRGNQLVPKALRFSNYKRFMRTAYALYMLAILLGVVVYILVYVYGI
jgi:putative membrane protein